MNDTQQTATAVNQHPGRLYLVAGMLLAVVGITIYVFQVQAKVLNTPWYMPILATLGALAIVISLVQSRSIWRWGAAGLFTLLAAFEWFMLVVALGVPAYTGSIKVGQPFPEFATSLADGSTFTQADLKGDQNTVLLFFRGRW